MIPGNLKEILSNLEYLSMLEQGQKPCMNDQTFVNASSWYGAFVRSIKGEGRRSMILQINSIVDQALDALEKYKGQHFYGLLVKELIAARNGLTNLTKTYTKYPRTVSDLRICIANINLQLNIHCKSYLQEITKEQENETNYFSPVLSNTQTPPTIYPTVSTVAPHTVLDNQPPQYTFNRPSNSLYATQQ
jgi:hypothetical protein